jgi:alpha-L-fucosidase
MAASMGSFLLVVTMFNLLLPTPMDSALTITREEVVKRAVQVRPSPRQLAWQQGEFISFIHFGVNTFTGREWGTGRETPSLFNPKYLDTDQWCRLVKAAGMTKVILTVKHHDGFCLWQTRYTKHSVAASPWRNGRGDVLSDLAVSCRKYGLQVGIYLSPADLYQIESANGLYGNLSAYTNRLIPRPVRGRPFKNPSRFRFYCDDYNEYFMNQLFELLTEYGPIHEVWLDGAHPKRKGGQTYTYANWYHLVRTLAPQAVIFGKGPDVRWCGNESGRTRRAEWSVIPLPTTADKFNWPDMTAENLGTIAQLQRALENGGSLHWYPAETNISIRQGWFWRDENQSVRSVAELLDIWYRSVGGNTVFLLNVPPNRDGRISQRDGRVLMDLGKIIKKTFANNLAEGATARAGQERGPRFVAANVLDGNDKSCWMPADGHIKSQLILSLKNPRRFNRITLQEQIGDYGQRIAAFAIEALHNGRWQEVTAGRTVGYKKICCFPAITTDRLRIRILKSRMCPTLSEVGIYHDTFLNGSKGGE